MATAMAGVDEARVPTFLAPASNPALRAAEVCKIQLAEVPKNRYDYIIPSQI